jgi:hypothetical protein
VFETLVTHCLAETRKHCHSNKWRLGIPPKLDDITHCENRMLVETTAATQCTDGIWVQSMRTEFRCIRVIHPAAQHRCSSEATIIGDGADWINEACESLDDKSVRTFCVGQN